MSKKEEVGSMCVNERRIDVGAPRVGHAGSRPDKLMNFWRFSNFYGFRGAVFSFLKYFCVLSWNAGQRCDQVVLFKKCLAIFDTNLDTFSLQCT